MGGWNRKLSNTFFSSLPSGRLQVHALGFTNQTDPPPENDSEANNKQEATINFLLMVELGKTWLGSWVKCCSSTTIVPIVSRHRNTAGMLVLAMVYTGTGWVAAVLHHNLKDHLKLFLSLVLQFSCIL